ncbi:MAG: hypothetical protein M1125_00280 [Candidatus Marsarchaeota archaeon]|nr:hypothetical protein [Candidatus Marsarchaeota archaeon]
MKYKEMLESTFNSIDYPVFTFRDAELALKKKGITARYLRLMMHKYYASGRIKRITKGVYTFHDDAIVAGFAFQPFYYGLESALSILGVSTQASNNIVMTTRNVRTGIRSFQGRNYKILRIKSELLFGFSTMRVGGFMVPVSDLEKTVIDMLYLKVPIREELYPEISKRLDKRKFEAYMKMLDKDLLESGQKFLIKIKA